MEMRGIKITVKGITPLLMNKFTDKAQLAASSGKRLSTVGEQEPPRVAAESVLHVNSKGAVIVPYDWIFGCLVNAGRYFKVGKRQLSTTKSSMLAGCMEINDPYFKLVNKGGWKVDTRPIRNPVTGGRRLRHRPCFDDWSFTFEVQIDTDVVSLNLFREVVDVGGRRVGVGDYRPDCRGPFGRFKVIKWVEI